MGKGRIANTRAHTHTLMFCLVLPSPLSREKCSCIIIFIVTMFQVPANKLVVSVHKWWEAWPSLLRPPGIIIIKYEEHFTCNHRASWIVLAFKHSFIYSTGTHAHVTYSRTHLTCTCIPLQQGYPLNRLWYICHAHNQTGQDRGYSM